MTVRVLHVVATAQRRGAEMFALDLVRALAGEGLDQRVAVLRDGYGDLRFDAPTTVLPARGWRLPGPRVDVRTMRALRALVRGWRPDVIQAHGGEPYKYCALGRVGPPIVYRRIGYASPWATRGARRVAHARLLRRARRVVTVADAVRKETVETFGVPEGSVVTIPRGVDPDRLRPVRSRADTRRALGIPPGAPVVLSLGALTWEKDPLAHMEVMRRVSRRVPDAVHLVAGDGPLRPAVEEAVRADGRGNAVRMLGVRLDVGDLLTGSDVMLLASRSEGMPGCLIEAGLTGVPVAAYVVAGVPEVVVDRRSGLLAPAGDEEALAERVVELLLDDEGRKAMGRAARELCRRFEIGPVAARYRSLYQQVAAG